MNNSQIIKTKHSETPLAEKQVNRYDIDNTNVSVFDWSRSEEDVLPNFPHQQPEGKKYTESYMVLKTTNGSSGTESSKIPVTPFKWNSNTITVSEKKDLVLPQIQNSDIPTLKTSGMSMGSATSYNHFPKTLNKKITSQIIVQKENKRFIQKHKTIVRFSKVDSSKTTNASEQCPTSSLTVIRKNNLSAKKRKEVVMISPEAIQEIGTMLRTTPRLFQIPQLDTREECTTSLSTVIDMNAYVQQDKVLNAINNIKIDSHIELEGYKNKNIFLKSSSNELNGIHTSLGICEKSENNASSTTSKLDAGALCEKQSAIEKAQEIKKQLRLKKQGKERIEYLWQEIHKYPDVTKFLGYAKSKIPLTVAPETEKSKASVNVEPIAEQTDKINIAINNVRIHDTTKARSDIGTPSTALTLYKPIHKEPKSLLSLGNFRNLSLPSMIRMYIPYLTSVTYDSKQKLIMNMIGGNVSKLSMGTTSINRDRINETTKDKSEGRTQSNALTLYKPIHKKPRSLLSLGNFRNLSLPSMIRMYIPHLTSGTYDSKRKLIMNMIGGNVSKLSMGTTSINRDRINETTKDKSEGRTQSNALTLYKHH